MFLEFKSATEKKCIYVNPWHIISVECESIDNVKCTCITTTNWALYVKESVEEVVDRVTKALEDMQ